jgi:hypothetical protein
MARGASLETAVFVELDGKVWVLEKDRPVRRAALKSRVVGGSSVKTGDRSRAEMEFEDRSLVRLGSNAVFAVRLGTRDLTLEEGALLLQVPKGVGGTTTIHTAGATAAITGTTVIVSATKGGGFRMIVLEGVADVRYANGRRVRCRAGDMTVKKAGAFEPEGPTQIDVKGLVSSSLLVKGFDRRLPSWALIDAVIRMQSEQLASGEIRDTGGYFGTTSLGDRDRIRSFSRNLKIDDVRDKKPRNITPGPGR